MEGEGERRNSTSLPKWGIKVDFEVSSEQFLGAFRSLQER